MWDPASPVPLLPQLSPAWPLLKLQGVSHLASGQWLCKPHFHSIAACGT